MPNVLKQQMFLKLIKITDTSKICSGNVDAVDMGNARKGRFLTTDGMTKAIVEEGLPSSVIEWKNLYINSKND